MKEQTKTLFFVTGYIVLLLIYINVVFYHSYKLPFGMLDVDGYLFHSGDKDPRLNHVNDGRRLNMYAKYDYTIFYYILDKLGNPRHTLLWFPPLLLGIILIQIYFIYDKIGKYALDKTLIFLCLTYNIPFYFTAALYRQILAMALVLIGYNLVIRRYKPGYLIITLGILTHIHLAPIVAIYLIAQKIKEKEYIQTWILLTGGLLLSIKTKLIWAIGILTNKPQPSLYTLFFTLTNPLLLIYGFKKIKWDLQHIMLIILLLSMPLVDQSRGIIFLHIVLVSIAYDKYKQEETPKYYIALIVILAFIWQTNLINFLLNSMVKDGLERNLDLKPMFDFLSLHN